MKESSPTPRRVRWGAALAARALAISVACLLLFQGTAAARAPILNSVEYMSGALTATWTLPPGVRASGFEASRSPKLEADGGFDHLDVYEELEADATGITVRQRYERQFRLWVFEPGTYYVHVGGSDPDCEPCPTVEYSEIMTVVVARRPWTDANAICRAYIPDAERLARRARRARTPRAIAGVLDDFADVVGELVGDFREQLTPPPGGSRKALFEAMVNAAKRGARFDRRAADALRDGNIGRGARNLDNAIRAFQTATRLAKRLALPTCRKLLE